MAQNSKTARMYDFWLDPQPASLGEHPFSGITETTTGARWWAENLLRLNKQANAVTYRAVNGRKVYRVTRSELKENQPIA